MPLNHFHKSLLTTMMKWGKDKTPNSQGFDPSQQAYSPQSAQTPAYPGTPSTYFPQYGGKRQSASSDYVSHANGMIYRPTVWRSARQLHRPKCSIPCRLWRTASYGIRRSPECWWLWPWPTATESAVDSASSSRAELQQWLHRLPGVVCNRTHSK